MADTQPKFQKYIIDVKTFSQSGMIPRSRNLNGFTVTNIGDRNVKINGKILFASATPTTDLGDSVSFGGNLGEIFANNIELQILAGAGTAPLVEIIFKYYVDIAESYKTGGQ